jgi:hypothetical protein
MRGSYKIIPGMKSANLITAVQTLERHLQAAYRISGT